jgi:hypothetical protein
VTAVDTFDISTEWLDPEVLPSLAASARRMTFREGEVVTTALELIHRVR